MEAKEIAEQLKKSFEDFKSENDRRLKEIESKGRADPLTEAKIDKHSAAIGELQKQLDEVAKKAQRVAPVAGGEQNEAKAEYRKAFDGFLRKGKNEDRLLDLEAKALQTTVAADGGYAIPEELQRNIKVMEAQAAPMINEVDVITASAETYEQLLEDGDASYEWVGETSARSETTSPTLASFTPFYGEISAMPKATQKMLDDGMIDMGAWLEKKIAEAFAAGKDVSIISGNGTNKPKGILGYTLSTTGDASRAYGQIQKVNSGTSGDFDADDLIDLTVALRQGYRQGAKFVMPAATVAKIRKLKDANNQYIWLPGLGAAPQTCLGYSIVEDENVPAVAAAANAIIFGNLKRAYKFVNLKGIRTLRDPFTAKPYVSFYTTQRFGGGVEDTRAVKVLTLT
jgi:HK97 family phage major capsid protein